MFIRPKEDWVAALLVAFVVLMLTLACGTARAEEYLIPIQTILLEAQGESLDGQIAVAEVIRNRAIAGSRTHESVCKAPRQFSAWNSPTEAFKRLKGASTGAFDRASKAWEASETSNLTKGATHYFNPSLARPKWARGMVKTAVIGQHVFYKQRG